MEQNWIPATMEFGDYGFDRITEFIEFTVLEEKLGIIVHLPLYSNEFNKLKEIVGNKEISLTEAYCSKEIYFDELDDIHFLNDLIPLQEKLEQLNSLIGMNTSKFEINALIDIGIHKIDELIETVKQRGYFFYDRHNIEDKCYNVLINNKKLQKCFKKSGIFMTNNGILFFQEYTETENLNYQSNKKITQTKKISNSDIFDFLLT